MEKSFNSEVKWDEVSDGDDAKNGDVKQRDQDGVQRMIYEADFYSMVPRVLYIEKSS